MKLEYIEWADAVSPDINWWTKERALEWARTDNYWVSQVGWILEETSKHILISSQMNTTSSLESDEPVEQYSHIIKIPKVWIRKRKTLKV